MEIKKNKKRLVIELTDEEHEIIKTEAARKRTTIRKYVLRSVINKAKEEYLSKE